MPDGLLLRRRLGGALAAAEGAGGGTGALRGPLHADPPGGGPPAGRRPSGLQSAHRAPAGALPGARGKPEQHPPGHPARGGGADEVGADEDRAHHQRLPRHQNPPDLHRQLCGPAEKAGDAQRPGPGIPGGSGPPVRPAEKAHRGPGGGLQSLHGEPDGGLPAHRCQCPAHPEHRGIPGKIGGQGDGPDPHPRPGEPSHFRRRAAAVAGV